MYSKEGRFSMFSSYRRGCLFSRFSRGCYGGILRQHRRYSRKRISCTMRISGSACHPLQTVTHRHRSPPEGEQPGRGLFVNCRGGVGQNDGQDHAPSRHTPPGQRLTGWQGKGTRQDNESQAGAYGGNMSVVGFIFPRLLIMNSFGKNKSYSSGNINWICFDF